MFFESHGKDIKLKGSNMGFATDIFQTNRLGLRKTHGLQINADHTCVVFGEDGIDDATATIHLELSDTTSSVRENAWISPSFSADHYSIAEALSRTMGTWYVVFIGKVRGNCNFTSGGGTRGNESRSPLLYGSPLLQRGRP
jgi:hypothetical protein